MRNQWGHCDRFTFMECIIAVIERFLPMTIDCQEAGTR
jgi:hypothetical protein